jgi:hypothetical protein
MGVSALLAATFLLVSAGGALAQSVQNDRGFLSVNGGYRVSSSDFRDHAIFRVNAEDGRFDTDYSVTTGPTFDVFGGVLITSRFGVGGGVSRYSHSTPIAFLGSVPHPLFFNRFRSVTSEVSGLKRAELAVHVQAHHVLPVSRTLQIKLFGGPSYFRTVQGVVAGFVYADTYPYDEASFQHAETAEATAWTLGFNAGGDVAIFFTRRMGIGFSAQYADATVHLQSANGGTTDVKTGGVSTGAGLRFRF